MLVPNRHEDSKEYRYGFQGQEKDDEIRGGEGNSLNYTFRMHDPRIGRFFVTDPLEFKFPHNSPYAFSENKVINSVELEGLEHATIIYRYYYGSKIPALEVQWYNSAQHNAYGKLGKGVAFRYEKYDKKKNLTYASKTSFFERSGETNYGFYYGPQQMPEVFVIDRYLLEPIDAVDNAARTHDMAYDAVGATAEHPDSWAAIEADKSLIKASMNVHNLYHKGMNDPFNKQPITKTEDASAVNAILYFDTKVLSKIDDVSDFMEKNYPNLAHKASGLFNDDEGLQEKNYLLFRDMYMTTNNKGQWIQKEGMWKKNDEDVLIPKTSEDFKSSK